MNGELKSAIKEAIGSILFIVSMIAFAALCIMASDYHWN